jgi:Tfp pilus assembly protein PilX
MAAQFMKAPYRTFNALPSKQKGAVLLVSVVTLSLLALAGLSTVEQTVVQERTSVNASAADDATRNADKGLKQAVTDLTNGNVFTSGFCTEDLSIEDPETWECEKISPDGYTYVVSFIMNGNQPATDDNGDTIYKVSVVGVRSGSSGGSLATQSLTAGVVVRNVATAGVWDDAIVGCRNVNLKDDTRVVGDVRTKLSTSMLDTSSGASINGDAYYVDEEDVSGSVGTLSQVDADSCDPLNLPVIFGEFEAYVADDPDYQSDSYTSFPSAGDYYFDDWDDLDGSTVTFSAGTYNIYIRDKWKLEDVIIRINPNNADPVALNIFVGADGEGEIDLRDVTLSAVGGGSGASVQDQISIYANFGGQDDDTSCSGGSDEVRIREVESSGNDNTHPSNNFFGGRLYAPKATVCLRGVDYKGSIWGYNVITEDYDNHDTHFEFSGDVSDDSSSTSDYALLFYTRGDIDFVAGGATACEQDDDAGSGTGSSNNGSGEASVNCDAIDDDGSSNSNDQGDDGSNSDDNEADDGSNNEDDDDSAQADDGSNNEDDDDSAESDDGSSSDDGDDSEESSDGSESDDSSEDDDGSNNASQQDLSECEPSGKNKVEICHNGNTIEVNKSAWNGHQNHSEDYCGACQ